MGVSESPEYSPEQVELFKEKAYALTPVGEKDKYFMDPETMADIQEGINQYREGKTTKVDKADFDKLLGL
jgi:antitoxin YefM